MREGSDTAGLARSDDARQRPTGPSAGRGYRRLFAILLIGGWAAAAIVAAVHWTPLRAAAGLLLVGVVPGALASYAALPPSSRIDGRLRLVLVVALSVTIALLLGLGLALKSDEVSRTAAAIGLAVAATVAAIIAFARDDGRTALVAPPRPRVSPAVAIVTGVLAIGAVALVVAALNVDTQQVHYTALYLTKDDDGVRLTVNSREDRQERFRYVLRDGSGVRLYSGAIRLESGQEGAVVLPVAAGAGLLRADLYKQGSTSPYRSVDLRL